MPGEKNELRMDWLLNRGVIIAKSRAKRPQDFIQKKAPVQEGTCFFCPGNEHLTPPEIARVEGNPPFRLVPASPAVASGKLQAQKEGWLIRCFPNKFNAVALDYPKAYGTHEIIVETNEHAKTLSELSEPHIEKVLELYCHRINALRKNKRIKYISIFKNEGKEAGASLAHTHTQLISQDMIPPLVQDEINANRAFKKKHGKCFYCKSKKLEAKRLVFENKHFIAFCPFASRFHFETWVVSKRHAGQLTDFSEEERASLAQALKFVLGKLDSKLGKPAYNFHLHASPLAGDETYHFHIEINPRLAVWAGYEFCTGLYINSLPPEEAAKALRQ